MTLFNSKIASKVLSALAEDYAGMPECDDHAGKAWHKLFKKADELGLLNDELLQAMLCERLRSLGDANLRFERVTDLDTAAAPAPCTLAMRGQAAVLTVGNLDTTQAADALAANADSVRNAKMLVIDVRACTGGIEQAAYPLLDWLFDEETTLAGLIGTQKVLSNYSAGNCKARVEQFGQLKALLQAQGAADTTSWLDQGIQVAQDNYGKGYVEEELQPADIAVKAAPVGQKVAVLISRATSDAAEWLAQVAQKSSRVTLVGEPTCGTLDYSNPVSLAFDGRFVFTYPMSKTVEASQGKGARGTGILPGVTCPADEALEQALSL
jgi:hypothetical protein